MTLLIEDERDHVADRDARKRRGERRSSDRGIRYNPTANQPCLRCRNGGQLTNPHLSRLIRHCSARGLPPSLSNAAERTIRRTRIRNNCELREAHAQGA